jgi:chaperonin GroES
MSFRPILDKIIVKLQEPDETTAGGLIIANAKNDGVVEGDVISVGPGGYDDKGNRVEITIEPGSKILLNAGAGTPMEYDGETYNVIVEDEVIAILS